MCANASNRAWWLPNDWPGISGRLGQCATGTSATAHRIGCAGAATAFTGNATATTPPHPVHITVEGECKFGPLRSNGFGDFAPDDPAAALHLPDELVAGLYAWAAGIDNTLNLDVRDRDDGKYDAEWQRLFREGMEPARQVAHELGPARTVTYKGLAHGGLAALTSVTWQGDREL
ncbi:hypothetical protein [Streptomyces sp. NBC_00996]|uniref:hypothetical protein n=1 Tax=Streptomyces sp. NBC_00996 TaxID=2903710 RepID=UPI00386E9D71|nr:hypothetical protein OG390_03580 [Streptomyces sp. NBC_00996]